MSASQVILLIETIFAYWFIYSLRKKKFIPSFLLVILGVSFSFWYTIPVLLSNIGYWFIFESMVKISINEYNLFAIGEISFFILILCIFKYSLKYRIRNIITIKERPHLRNKELFLIIYSILFLIYNFIFNSNYIKNNDISEAQNGIFVLFYFFASYLTSYFYVNIFLNSSNKRNSLFLALIIIFSVYSVFVAGARIYLIVFIWLYVAKKWKYIREKKKMKLFFPVLILILCISFLLPFLANKRTGNENNSLDWSSVGNLTLFHLNLKLNSIAYSTALITYDGEGFASYKPYIGSLFKYIPRAVWTNKPTPTSYDGTIAGTPSRRIPTLLNFQDVEYANVGVSAFTVSLWQGVFFVLLALLINVIYLRIILALFTNNSYWVKAIGFNLLYFPQLILTPSFGDNLIQKIFEIFILVAFLFLFGILKFKTIFNENYYVSRRFR